MPALCSIATIGDKLVVGQVDTSFLTASSRVIPGTAVLNGPVFIGATPQVGIARAACMIGPPLGSLAAPASLEVTGITNIFGSLNVTAVSTFTGLTTKLGTTIKQALSLKNGVDLKNALDLGNSNTLRNAPSIFHGSMTVNGVITCNDVSIPLSTLSATYEIAISKKPFDILHPTKKDHRLRYVSLEGPAAEVYVRGFLNGETTIQLPDYWKGLVDMNTIGVQLTPIRMHQELYIDSLDENTIKVKNNAGGKIMCYYTVTAERKDTERNIPEYKGLTPNDYPGDNSEYRL